MDNKGYIEIHITGRKGNNELSPENFDIKEIVSLLTNVESLLYPNNKKNRPEISYSMSSGSVRNFFHVSKQAEVAFASMMALIMSSGSIDCLEANTASAIEQLQATAKKNDYSFELLTSDVSLPSMSITPTTHYYRTDKMWVEAEFYFYGTLVDAGGKDKSNIHLETKDYGSIVISTDREMLKNQEKNLLYKDFGVRVHGMQNVVTGEIDRGALSLIEFVDYSPAYDAEYFSRLLKRVGSKWDGIDADDFIAEIRGYHE